jgi:biopolymer transport protein ExbD
MERHHARHKRSVSLNLVSLMDIFTILVFFLLVNSGEVQTLPNAKDMALPESVAEQRARETVIVTVTDTDLLVQGQLVANIPEVMRREDLIIPELRAALQSQTDRTLRQDAREDVAGREVTIMGDKEIPYSLLKRIMATCTDAEYGQLSLAVLQVSSDVQIATLTGSGG